MERKTQKGTGLNLNFSKITLISICCNIIFLIFGIIIYTNPYFTANLTAIILGIYFIIYGLYNVYIYFERSITPLYNYKLLLGIVTFILGIFVILNPFKFIKILTITLGLYLIVLAITKLLESLKLKKVKYEGWLIVFVISIILLLFGIFITINPMASMDLVEATGIFIILGCILDLSHTLMFYSKRKELLKLFK